MSTKMLETAVGVKSTETTGAKSSEVEASEDMEVPQVAKATTMAMEAGNIVVTNDSANKEISGVSEADGISVEKYKW